MIYFWHLLTHLTCPRLLSLLLVTFSIFQWSCNSLSRDHFIAWLQGRLWVIVWSDSQVSGLQKYPAYGTLQKDIADSWRWWICANLVDIPKLHCMYTRCFLVRSCIVLRMHCPLNISRRIHLLCCSLMKNHSIAQYCTAATRTPSFPPRSMPEWKPNRFSSPTVQIKVRGGLGEFSGSWGIRLEDYLPACVMEAKSCPVAPCSHWVWPWSVATL